MGLIMPTRASCFSANRITPMMSRLLSEGVVLYRSVKIQSCLIFEVRASILRTIDSVSSLANEALSNSTLVSAVVFLPPDETHDLERFPSLK